MCQLGHTAMLEFIVPAQVPPRCPDVFFFWNANVQNYPVVGIGNSQSDKTLVKVNQKKILA